MKRKFTLIELLVVISIIVILAALLLPAIAQVKKSAQKIVCANNSKQLYLSYSMYNNDFQRQPTMRYEATGINAKIAGNIIKYDTLWLSYGKLYEDAYLKNGKSFYCPGKDSFHKPDGQQSYEGLYSNNNYGWNPASTRIYTNYWLRWSEATIFSEEVALSAHITPMKAKLELNDPSTWLSSDTWGYWNYTSDEYWIPHKDGLNILFIDGHVKYYKLTMPQILNYGSSYSGVISKITGTYK